ncbi:methyltransferase-like protein 2 isoform X2 [Humulus lupulus]|uniref:methyltransferase-like protein 2 isoform X2 n=1 Tax=Humulus lupulus TaxID=3486 RepID=UPI002B405E22|nr:methyltransferase-like protein 2 isoform X2 [Humulus lupulus]
MAVLEMNKKLSTFLESGVYRFEDCNAVFIDSVHVLNRSYSRFRVSPSEYYSRFFESNDVTQDASSSRKRKRKKKTKPHTLNERERVADQRHQEAKPLLLKASESLLRATDLLEVMNNLRDGSGSSYLKNRGLSSSSTSARESFIELGRVWQAPLYEITLKLHPNETRGYSTPQFCERVIPVFNNLISNETSDDVEAEFMDTQYILPPDGCFYMSDLRQIHNLIPAEKDCGFNLIVIDPPWENGSAYQKSRYPTLPNKYFLSLPIKQLSHTKGALVALWVTNREKLRCFVEKELFPAWGVKYISTFYWLKVKADGSLISDLDLFHHRPYECILLGRCHGEPLDSSSTEIETIQDNQIIISIPGDYSRKPPVGGVCCWG